MSDRIFAAAIGVVALIYGWIALTAIKAPFQYDPLGPESWPQLLALVMLMCVAGLLWRPEVHRFDLGRSSALRLLLMVGLLLAYAWLFRPLGFILSTFAFAALNARIMGARWLPSGLFGLGMGVGGYLLCAGLLDLNLPEGPLPGF